MSGLTVIADKPAAAATQGAANFTCNIHVTHKMHGIIQFYINAHKYTYTNKNTHKHTQLKKRKQTLIHTDTESDKLTDTHMHGDTETFAQYT